MDNNQKQDWWPDTEGYSSNPNPDTQPTPTLSNEFVPAEMNDMITNQESNINTATSEDKFASAEMVEITESTEEPMESTEKAVEEPNPYIQYPWNQIPRQPNQQQGENQQTPYGYRQSSYQQNSYQNNSYQQNLYSGQYMQQRPSNSFATAAMVMGIVSLVVTCCGGSFIFGALGIIFAMLSRKAQKLENQAKTGLILSIIGFVGGIVLVIAFLAMLLSPEYQNIFGEYQRFYNEYEDDAGVYEDFEEFYFEDNDFDDIFEDSL